MRVIESVFLADLHDPSSPSSQRSWSIREGWRAAVHQEIALGATTALVSPAPLTGQGNCYLLALQAERPFRLIINNYSTPAGILCLGSFVGFINSATFTMRNNAAYAEGNRVEIFAAFRGTGV